MTQKNTRRGFTLIELLVVVLIIGILVAVAVPQYRAALDKVSYAKADLIARRLAQSLEYYYLENGFYPTDWRNLDFDVEGCTVGKAKIECESVQIANTPIRFIPEPNRTHFYFTMLSEDAFFRNVYYLRHAENDYPGKWYCGPLGRSGRGSKICANVCGRGLGCFYD